MMSEVIRHICLAGGTFCLGIAAALALLFYISSKYTPDPEMEGCLGLILIAPFVAAGLYLLSRGMV